MKYDSRKSPTCEHNDKRKISIIKLKIKLLSWGKKKRELQIANKKPPKTPETVLFGLIFLSIFGPPKAFPEK